MGRIANRRGLPRFIIVGMSAARAIVKRVLGVDSWFWVVVGGFDPGPSGWRAGA